MRRQRLFTLVAATLPAALWTYACGDGATDPPPPDPPRPVVVGIVPQATQLWVRGATVQLRAQVRDQKARVMSDVAVSWASNDPSVATVDGWGLVTAIDNGRATITATAGSASGRATVTVLESPDRAALIALYNATDGPNWVDAENWLTDKPLGDWYGVDTNDSGRIVSLDLRGEWDSEAGLPIPHGLSGSIPPELGSLANLANLDLGYNNLTGPMPPELGNLANLRRISVTRNSLTGIVPPELGNLERLTLFALGGNAFSGEIPPELGNLAGLTELYLWRNNLTGPIPAELGSLANLTDLYLSDNHLTGPIPNELGGLVSLTRLSLWGNSLTGAIPTELGSLTDLTELYLGDNDLTGPIPTEFGNLASLTELFLRGNDHTGPIPAELGSLANLTELRLGGNDLTGPIPPQLGRLAQLTELSLSGNDLTGPIPAELGSLANLTDLHLGGNDLTGPIPPELGNLASVERLLLRDNDLTGGIPTELANLQSATILSLSGNQLSGPIPPELGNLGDLETLNVASNELSGTIPRELGRLSTLEALFLDYNDLEGSVPLEFEGMSRLLELGLSFNGGLAGALPVELTALRQLDALVAGGTGLCAPADPAFQTWLAGIFRRRIASCVEEAPAAAYLVQAVQSRQFPVPLVAGEKALLRVFVTGRDTTSAGGIPQVRATFYIDGTETHVEEIPGTSGPIPTEVDESSLSSSANAEMPGHVVQPGLEMVIEVDPEGTLDPELGVARRIPETGRLAVEVREMPVFDLTLVPFIWTETDDSSIVDLTRAMAADPETHEMFGDMHLLPIGEMRVTAHEPVLSSRNSAFDLLRQTVAIRAMEGGTGHYKGMMGRPVTYAGGVAYRPGRSSFSQPWPDIIAHELGHNLSLRHAPCGGAGGPDPSYPYPDGSIGAWGYDFNDGGRLVDPRTNELMSYCGPDWISDYYFTSALRFRLDDADSVGLRAPPPVASTATRSLLLWGGIDLDGVPYLEPAFVVDAPTLLPGSPGDHRLIGRSGDGTELFSLTFAMPEVADGDGSSSFAFVVPVQAGWENGLTTITLTGPGGTVTLDGETDLAMAILRNPRNGQVRGILRDPPPANQVAAAVAPGAPGLALEVLFSRGMPGAEAWRR